MIFPFSYDLAVDGWCIAEISGRVELIEDHGFFIGRTPGASDIDWSLGDIEIDAVGETKGGGYRFGVTGLPAGHWLDEHIRGWLLATQRERIDAVWVERERDERIAA